MKFEITGNGGNGMNHFFAIGQVVERVQTDTDGTAMYMSMEDEDFLQWVGDDDVKEVL